MKWRFPAGWHCACLLMCAAVCATVATPIQAQANRHDPLTEAEVEKVREAGIDPDARIRLYTKFVDDRVATVKQLMNRAKSEKRAQRLDGALQDVSALIDELGSNLDEYSDRHADLRKSLKTLADSSKEWLTTLRALAGEPEFDLSRKDAIESADDMTAESARLLREQTDYFAAHKDQAGQDRAEPNP